MLCNGKQAIQLFVIWLMFSVSLPSHAAGTDSLLNYALKNLNTGRLEPLQEFSGKPVIISFFEPECSWCFKQLKDLEKLSHRCDQAIQPLAIGVNGATPELKQLFARTRVSFPAFVASKRLQADIGGIPATPISVFIGAQGQLLGATRGYKPLPELYELLSQVEIPVSENLSVIEETATTKSSGRYDKA